jgi:hypothetical protein
MKQSFRLLTGVILFLAIFTSHGCSTVCPEGIKFGPYAAMCAPYEMYKLGESITQDLKPGGMLNPDGKPDGMTDADYAVYRLNKRIDEWFAVKRNECLEKFIKTDETNIFIKEKIEFDDLKADCITICTLNKANPDNLVFRATLIKDNETIRSYPVSLPPKKAETN